MRLSVPWLASWTLLALTACGGDDGGSGGSDDPSGASEPTVGGTSGSSGDATAPTTGEPATGSSSTGGSDSDSATMTGEPTTTTGPITGDDTTGTATSTTTTADTTTGTTGDDTTGTTGDDTTGTTGDDTTGGVMSIDCLVEPFVNEGADPEIEYLADGMTESLIASLSQVPNLNVKARSTVFRFKGKDADIRTLGNQLNVQAILSGRLVPRGNDVALYLELIDASFSFDGVIGAFALTSDPIIIAIGLGIGALFVRSMTVYLVRQGTLQQYVFLEHGAHWAIGALAVLLLVSIKTEVPELITGLIGVGFILAAFATSVVRNRHVNAPNQDGRAEGSTLASVSEDR